jgi:hypothetical protein
MRGADRRRARAANPLLFITKRVRILGSTQSHPENLYEALGRTAGATRHGAGGLGGSGQRVCGQAVDVLPAD